MSQVRCYTCLQRGRKLSPLKAQVKFVFALLCPEMFINTKDTAQFSICWECEFMADKIKRFQTILKTANKTLNLSFEGVTTIVKGLSCLKVTAVETISLTLPQSTPFLPENELTLPKNELMLPQNEEILPQNELMLPQNEEILPQNERMLPQNELILPLNVPMLPKIVPIKLNTQDEVKIERDEVEKCSNYFDELIQSTNVLEVPMALSGEVKLELNEEEKCSNDFDELIQPTTIMQVPMDLSDPLLILRLNQPAEIKKPHQKLIKDDNTDPEIIYKPQKVFINAPEYEVELRGFKEAKVTLDGPHLEKRTETNPAEKTPVRSKKSDELLTKLLTTPSKCEELFLKRERVLYSNSSKEPERSGVDRKGVPNSNTANESQFSEQSAGDACGDDEAKLIILNRTELDAFREKKRLKPAYLAATHKCDRCIERFNSQDKWDEHYLKHDEKSGGNSICEICEQRFPDDSLRSEHYKQHFILYGCRKCPNRYSNRVQLSTHCRRIHEESTFLCKKCFVVFKTFKERSTHIFQMHNQRQGCGECGKTFVSAQVLKAHVLNTHSNSKSVSCPVCKKRVKIQSLKTHMKLHDDKGEDDRSYCADCGTSFKWKHSYEYHLKNSIKHNTIESLGHKCDHCEKYFANKDSLKNHTDEIGGIKYICDICLKASKTKRVLARHIQTVHGMNKGKKPKKRPFVCESCGKSFSIKKCLREHLNVHAGIRPHVCKDCGATFTYSAALFTHRRLKHKVKRKYEMASKTAKECAVKE